MKLTTQNGKTTAEAETPVEQKALEHLSNHRPIFACAEEYQVKGYIAGYERALSDVGMGKDDGELRMFRNLSETEQAEFRQWARENYNRGDMINGIWHPVIQLECVRMNTETL